MNPPVTTKETVPPAPNSSKYGKVTLENGTLHDGEPVFVLRASDASAIRTIAHYHQYLAGIEADDRKRDPQFLAAIEVDISRFAAWQAANTDLVKLPD